MIHTYVIKEKYIKTSKQLNSHKTYKLNMPKMIYIHYCRRIKNG